MPEIGEYIAVDLDENNRYSINEWLERNPGRTHTTFGWGVCRQGYGLQSHYGILDEHQAREWARRMNGENMSNLLDRYTVVKTDSEEIPYELHGARGARYGLMRNVPNPHMMFAVNLRGLGCVDRLGWFTDKDGELKSA